MQKSKMHVLIRYQIASSDVNNITPQTREALMAEGQFRRDDLLRQVNDDIKRSTNPSQTPLPKCLSQTQIPAPRTQTHTRPPTKMRLPSKKRLRISPSSSRLASLA